MTQPTLGEQLQAARTRKGVSTSEAAAATRMKVQQLEGMERNDFSAMAAPAYAKGFIRLYAEYLGLEAQPLIDEYLRVHVTGERPRLMPDSQRRKTGKALQRGLARLVTNLKGVPREHVRRTVLAVVAAVAVALLVTGILHLARQAKKTARAPRAAPQQSAAAIIQEPPAPYMDEAAAKP